MKGTENMNAKDFVNESDNWKSLDKNRAAIQCDDVGFKVVYHGGAATHLPLEQAIEVLGTWNAAAMRAEREIAEARSGG